MPMKKHLVILNPAAGGGRCGKIAPRILEQLRQGGISVEVAATKKSGDAAQLAIQGYQQGVRHFLAAGGDGTSYEIINGLFSAGIPPEQSTLGFLPLGTGNSFLRDFTDQGLNYALQAILKGDSRPCDVLRLQHKEGQLHFINLLSFGFTAEAGELTNSRYKSLGEVGYLTAIFLTWLRLHYPVFPLRLESERELNQQPCIYLTFSNSRYTGGKLMIAPFADTADGLIEVTRVGPLGRWDFVRTFPKIFAGQHMQHPLISHEATKAVTFQLPAPIDVMIDGEVVHCHPKSLEVLPSAIRVMV
jgi:diacylglycerol kinase (ATP)